MPPPLKCLTNTVSISLNAKQVCRAAQSRTFSTTLARSRSGRVTRARVSLYRWLATTGETYRVAPVGSTQYLGSGTKGGKPKAEEENDDEDGETSDKEIKPDQGRTKPLTPFPNNREFVSQPVLSEKFREQIWHAVMQDGKSVRDVSSEFGVDMARVGAVVRLKEIEKEWKRIGKPLAMPYHDAILGMLPISRHKSELAKMSPDMEKRFGGTQVHESINDLIMHPYTFPQIWHPTSESRIFTRADAAKAFHDTLLPADDRVPHPELALMHKDKLSGLSKEAIEANQAKRDDAADALRRKRMKSMKGPPVKEVNGSRWQFKFTEVNVDDVGKDGRGHKGVGWRYGMPFMDRTRGDVKIPKRVD